MAKKKKKKVSFFKEWTKDANQMTNRHEKRYSIHQGNKIKITKRIPHSYQNCSN